MEISAINRKKIYQSVIEQFIKLIKDGKLKIGDKLPAERQLSEMFNVSRASIREAFSAMEIIGLIDVRPGEGSFITDINIVPFINTIAPLFIRNENMKKELLEFRMLLELEAVKLAAEKSDGTKKESIEEILKLMDSSNKSNDANLGAEADIMFHKEIFRLTDNYILIKASECVAHILESSVRFNRAKILEDSKNSRVLLSQHKLIYKAIISGESSIAQERMKEHLEFVQKVS